MRFRTYTTLGALASAIGGIALAAVLLHYLLYADWWLIGATLTVAALAAAYGLISAHRQSSPYGDMTVKEVRERQRRGELPPPLTPDQLRGWRRMMVLMWLAVPALPLLLRYAGLD
jgi:membrane protein implicated in regulation of membrane protease activity